MRETVREGPSSSLALRTEGARGEDPAVAPGSGEHVRAAGRRGDEDLGPATTRTCLLRQPRALTRVSNFRREQSRADTSTTVSCDPEQRTGGQSPDAREPRRERAAPEAAARGAHAASARSVRSQPPGCVLVSPRPRGRSEQNGHEVRVRHTQRTCANRYENNGQPPEEWAKVSSGPLAERGPQRPGAGNSHLLRHRECDGDGSGRRRTRSARLVGEAQGPRVAATRGAAAGADRRRTLRALRGRARQSVRAPCACLVDWPSGHAPRRGHAH